MGTDTVDDLDVGSPAPAGPVVRAAGLGVRGPRGWVFSGVDLEVLPRELVIVEGPAGSGRTSLLLCVTGRMSPAVGELTVAGLPLPAQARQVRRRTAVARISEHVELEPGLTIGESVAERIVVDNLDRGFAQLRFIAAREMVGLTAPDHEIVEHLSALDRTRLAVALALLAEVDLIALDDADEDLHSHDEAALWTLLREVAASGPAVVASTVDAGHAAADRVLRLGRPLTAGATPANGGKPPTDTSPTPTDTSDIPTSPTPTDDNKPPTDPGTTATGGEAIPPGSGEQPTDGDETPAGAGRDAEPERAEESQ